MDFLMISCKKATLLISKKEENKLSWIGKWQLRGHLTICSLCRKFEQQSGFIGRNAKLLHEYIHATLSPEIKEKIKAALKEQE